MFANQLCMRNKELANVLIEIVFVVSFQFVNDWRCPFESRSLFQPFFWNFEGITFLFFNSFILILNILHMQEQRIVNTLEDKQYWINCSYHAYQWNEMTGKDVHHQIQKVQGPNWWKQVKSILNYSPWLVSHSKHCYHYDESSHH